MSDAITLDVLSSSPVQLDVGDADPIAREEIAALATRVTTVEGDVSGLSTRMGAVEGDISTLGTTVDGIDARVEAIEADYVTSEDVMGALGGEAPTLVAGSSRAVLGDADAESWMERTTAADGAALIESVKGNTLRWNQLNKNDRLPQTAGGVTITTGANGAAIATGQATLDNSVPIGNIALTAGHKYLIKGCPAGGGASTYDLNVSGLGLDYGAGSMFTSPSDYTNTYLRLHVRLNVVFDNVTFYPQLFDLTAMFGAGNEPSTMAEFEALFPEPYYPYDAGSLLPVRMEGIETTGFNQWDEQWELGGININNGTDVAMTDRIRSKNYTTALPATTYFFGIPSSTSGNVHFYDADKGFISQVYKYNETFTTPSNCRFIRFAIQPTYGTTYKGDICINLSDPSRNGTYEPYWSSQRSIPAATYFPQGMRSAGSVRDELTATQAITRVGERAYQSGDESDASVITDGTVTHYALATPTTTPIDPPLPLSYRVGAGGTERVMVASGTTSAPPIFVTRYPLDPADLAASIAPVDGPIAKTNHQVGDLIMLGFALCKVTTAIARGEAITIGTNVTRTSVAAEIAALS